jgi:hypothetical protein
MGRPWEKWEKTMEKAVGKTMEKLKKHRTTMDHGKIMRE